MTDRGKLLMDDIRSIALAMESEEAQLLVSRSQASNSAIRSATIISTFGALFTMSIIEFFAVVVGRDTNRYISERDQAEQMLEGTVKRLEHLLAEIETLEGIIPICSYCNEIRNDKGAWEKLEAYVGSHSEAQFSHGICPGCMVKLQVREDLL